MHRQLKFAVLLIAFAATGCAASRAFRQGQNAERIGDPDAAVKYFTKAVQEDPDNLEYKIHMQRSQEEAARSHNLKAKDLERADQLDAALAEYRKSLDLVGTDRLVQAKAAELERTIRERVEASRPKPKIEQLQAQARAAYAPPLLDPASRVPLRINFGANSSLKDIINFIGTASGININYDTNYVDRPYSVNLDGVTVEEALNQVLSANQYYFKVTGPRTIIIIPDQPAKHQQYDDLMLRVFFINHADATELASLVTSIMRIPQMAVQPMVMPNKAANTITVRATGPVMDVFERLIKANDKPRAEVLLDLQMLEVNRGRLKRYGINLSAYALNLIFSPEVAPPNTSSGQAGAPPPFNLNTITRGVSTADFYLGVPTAVLNFLENDSHTKTLAKPQLRGQEGQKMTLNLGQQVPVLATVFGAAAAGGFATIPQSSYNYKDIGVNLDITPTRLTYDQGEILLDVSIENTAVGPTFDVGGQTAQSFTSRKAHTFLRLREGESSLLAGLIKQDTTKSKGGVAGLAGIPGLGRLFSTNETNDNDTDIVMLITPHIVRDHDLAASDVGNIYIGTQQNVGLSGPPQLIAPQPQEPAPAAPAAPPSTNPGTPNPPNMSPGGVPGPPFTSPGGVQPTMPPTTPPGTSPVPGVIPTPPPAAQPAAPATPPAAAQPPAAPPTTPPANPTAPPATPPAGAQPPAPSTPAQIIATPAGTEFRVGGAPFSVPITINNASRISTLTLTITYNPAVLDIRGVTDGTFMRQGGVTAPFTPKIDPVAGRVDIAITRTADQTGASGNNGLLAALMVAPKGAGSATITVTGVALTPERTPIAITSSPVTVTVR
jgi:general secretion pathway protein D